MFDSLNLDINFRILQQVSKCLDQTHICNLLTKVGSNESEIPRQTNSDSPRLVLCGLDDQWHDVGFVFIFGQYFSNFFERLSCQDSNLILLISGPVFQNRDE